MDEQAVITGIGVVCALGRTPDEVWEGLLGGRCGAARIDFIDFAEFPCKSAAITACPTPQDLHISPRDARIMNTHSFLLMESAVQAYKNAAIETAPEITPDAIGFFAGLPMVDYETDDLLAAVLKSSLPKGGLDHDAFYTKGYREIYPLWPLSMLNNIALCQSSVRLKIQGENAVFSAHADSGVSAIAEGIAAALSGRAKIVLAGGVSEKITPSSLARGHIAGVLKSREDGVLSCRPFSSLRCGTTPGDGAGFLAIETLSSAVARGVSPIAAIIGWGRAFGIGDDFCSGPTAAAIINSMSAALSMAGLRPADIGLLIAHGDGTSTGDKNEIEAVNELFKNCPISVISTKGALGNLYAAAAPLDTAVAAYVIKTGTIPPSLYSTPVDEAVRFDIVTENPLQKRVSRVMINCNSYEGQASSLIIERVA
ncbi:beta-ketoacyl-[acyl-carrier-protein] synthase family protein [Candidatus Magnetominusculus dajiuhuensis]|uniref:beta-ketoacyl-[acyl-carrier-protein] synthase family protein n=1 Tax=Candidatus Magnetominusculus dajiuhuensis TaxID=3137712 RepID=UPI003B4298FC